jgi:hypothetical protein
MTISDSEKEQLAAEARKAKVWAAEEAKAAADQKEKEDAARVHSMGRVEFESYKRAEFRKSEARRAEAERKAAADQSAA